MFKNITKNIIYLYKKNFKWKMILKHNLRKKNLNVYKKWKRN